MSTDILKVFGISFLVKQRYEDLIAISNKFKINII